MTTEMNATFVPDTLTPMLFEEASEAMSAALKGVLGTAPPLQVLALALAKTALETGRWQKIHCWNWGNIKAMPADKGMFTSFWCDEIIPGRGRVVVYPNGEERDARGSKGKDSYAVPPGHPWTRFRAFANRFDGAFAYVDFVAGRKRYQMAWQELLEGDPVGYVHALKAAGYFTADELPYRSAVVKLHAEFSKRLQSIKTTPVVLPDHEWDKLRARTASLQFDELAIIHQDTFAELSRASA